MHRLRENDLRHWLLLLFADRVDVADLRADYVPRIYAEMGGPAELGHNPGGAARKALALGAVLGLGYLATRRKARHRQLR
jgi:hypothetical protein